MIFLMLNKHLILPVFAAIMTNNSPFFRLFTNNANLRTEIRTHPFLFVSVFGMIVLGAVIHKLLKNN